MASASARASRIRFIALGAALGLSAIEAVGVVVNNASRGGAQDWRVFVDAGARAGTSALLHPSETTDAFAYPPGFAWMLVGFAHIPRETGFWIDIVLMLGCAVAAALIAARVYGLGPGTALALAFGWTPVLNAVAVGQNAARVDAADGPAARVSAVQADLRAAAVRGTRRSRPAARIRTGCGGRRAVVRCERHRNRRRLALAFRVGGDGRALQQRRLRLQRGQSNEPARAAAAGRDAALADRARGRRRAGRGAGRAASRRPARSRQRSLHRRRRAEPARLAVRRCARLSDDRAGLEPAPAARADLRSPDLGRRGARVRRSARAAGAGSRPARSSSSAAPSRGSSFGCGSRANR